MSNIQKTSQILSIAVLAILAGCGSNRSVSSDQHTDKYQLAQPEIDVKFKVFHFSNDSSRLYVQLDTKNLLYARRGGDEATATLKIDIEPIELGESPKAKLHKKSFQFVDRDSDKEPKILVASTNFALPFGNDYRLKITVRDMNKETSQKSVLEANKKIYSGSQNFIISDSDKRIPLFTNWIKANHAYTLTTNSSAPDVVSVHYYNRDFPMPAAPFSDYQPKPFDYTPDSSFTITTTGTHMADFKTSHSGFYHFQFDPTQKIGFSVFVSSDEFPEVTTIENMVDPFRYLVSGDEYSAIIDAPNQKALLESYWIEWAGSRDRARKSIQEYYQRVTDSNKLFSSYVEGWKSDRGLIYIVYGKPNKAYREGNVETWIYGEENNPLSITFHFVKVINPFTENDYRLNRQEMFKPSWYRAVNIWRDGRIY